MIFVSLLQQNLIWLICSYIFRYYILHYHDPSLKTFLFSAILAYVPSLANSIYWIITCYIWLLDAEKYSPKMFTKPEDLVMAGSVIHHSSQITFFVLLVLSVLALSVYVWISHELVKFLNEKTSRLSKTAIILNTQLVKAIHFQSLIPFLTLSGILTLYLMHYSLIDPIQIQALPSIFLSTTLSIFPMSYIIFMPPYFNFCFGKPKNEVTRFMKAKLKIGSTVVVAVQSVTGVYPLNTI